jgi:hypothetical protein
MSQCQVIVAASIAAAVSLGTGCSLARDVNGTSDAGVLPMVDANLGGHDVGTRPVDTGVDAPGEDAFVPPHDAWVMPGTDAWTPPPVDAWTPPPVDAWTPPPVDAWTPPPVDAWTLPPDDAWVAPRTCQDLFGGRSGYEDCGSSATSCTFYSNMGRQSCDTICGAVTGSTCTGGHNDGLTHCGNSGNIGCGTGGYSTGVCTCTHP